MILGIDVEGLNAAIRRLARGTFFTLTPAI